jgi:hypothetical protein
MERGTISYELANQIKIMTKILNRFNHNRLFSKLHLFLSAALAALRLLFWRGLIDTNVEPRQRIP